MWHDIVSRSLKREKREKFTKRKKELVELHALWKGCMPHALNELGLSSVSATCNMKGNNLDLGVKIDNSAEVINVAEAIEPSIFI